MQTLVVFAHGKESGPWGGKIRRLADIAQRHGAQVTSLDYANCPTPDAGVDKLRGLPCRRRSAWF